MATLRFGARLINCFSCGSGEEIGSSEGKAHTDTPITSPLVFRIAPPLLPGEMGAVTWILLCPDFCVLIPLMIPSEIGAFQILWLRCRGNRIALQRKSYLPDERYHYHQWKVEPLEQLPDLHS